MVAVGVDGSLESREALRWALAEARLRQTPLHAVYAWQLPVVVGWEYIPRDLIDPVFLENRAHQVVAAAVCEVAGESPDVEIESLAVEGPVVQVLLDAARDADLLVIGSRGHGGFAGLLLGSVGQQSIQHARCPVVIVRQSRTDTER